MPDQKREVLRAGLPEIYQKAGDASARWQKSFLQWNRINFIVLALAAAMSSLRSYLPTEVLRGAAAIMGAALLASGAVMSFWLRKSRLERRWYSARAVAESVKTLSWRYMMTAAPFEGGSPDAEAKAAALFESFVHDIAEQEEAPVPKIQEITAKMQEIRAWPRAARLTLYLQERLEEQRTWYAGNSERNEESGRRVLYMAVATQIVACVLALIPIFREIPDFGGVFATVSASALAWMQLKKYEDLTQAYKTAAKELSRIGSGVAPGWTPSDAELSRFVLDTENAISREHTLWLAKHI